jgi:hypothetical protein
MAHLKVRPFKTVGRSALKDFLGTGAMSDNRYYVKYSNVGLNEVLFFGLLVWKKRIAFPAIYAESSDPHQFLPSR